MMESAPDRLSHRPLPRERRRVSRMIGRWPAGIRFEDAVVPPEPMLRGGGGDGPGHWPASSLAIVARVAGRR